MKIHSHFRSSAAKTPVKFQSEQTIHAQIWWQHSFQKSLDKGFIRCWNLTPPFMSYTCYINHKCSKYKSNIAIPYQIFAAEMPWQCRKSQIVGYLWSNWNLMKYLVLTALILHRAHFDRKKIPSWIKFDGHFILLSSTSQYSDCNKILHIMTAMMLCHVQKCIMITWPVIEHKFPS